MSFSTRRQLNIARNEDNKNSKTHLDINGSEIINDLRFIFGIILQPENYLRGPSRLNECMFFHVMRDRMKCETSGNVPIINTISYI
jgi:hypothetical protein